MPQTPSRQQTPAVRLSPQAQSRIDANERAVQQAQADVYNPVKIFQDVLKAGQDTVKATSEFVMSGEDGRNFAENAGDMLIGNAARLGNTAKEGLVDPIAGLVQGRSVKDINAETNRDLYSNKGGALDVGTFYAGKNSTVESLPDFGKRFAGAGIGTATEVAPVLRGTSLLAKPGLSTTQKVIRGGLEGAAYGGAGTAGQQLVNTGQLDAGGILQGAALGAAMGGGIPALGYSQPINKAAQAVDSAKPTSVAKHPAVAEIDVHIKGLQQRFDNEPNSLVRYQLNKAITQANQERAITFKSVQNTARKNALEESSNAARRFVPGGTLDAPLNPKRTTGKPATTQAGQIANSQEAIEMPGQSLSTQPRQLSPDQMQSVESRANSLEDGRSPQLTQQPNQVLESSEKVLSLSSNVPQKVLSSKPAKYFFGDKKVVQDAVTSAQDRLSTLRNGKQEQLISRQAAQDIPTSKAPNTESSIENTQIQGTDTQALTDRTYTNNRPDIDTNQYVREMNKSQKDAMKDSKSPSKFISESKEKFIDDLAPIEDRLNKAIKKGAEVDPADHITYQLDRSRRAEGIMHAYVKDNGLDKVIQEVPNPKEFDQYLIARHAKELDAEVTTGRNAAKDAALVKQLDAKYGEAAKKVYAYNQKLLDTSVEYGLISKEAAAKLKKQYPEYVPFNRIFNEDELANLSMGSGKGDASISSQGVVKKIKGSKRAIASPLNSIIDKTRVVVEQGERNRAAQILASYRDLPGNPFNLKEIPANETIGSRPTVSYLDKGVKRVFETDKTIADAAKNMTRQDIGLWGRIAAVPARVLRGGATTVNVGFAGANVVKDVVGAAINSKHPFRIADPEAFGKALSAALYHNGKSYQELMREGVAGTSFDMFRNPMKSSVGEIRSHKNPATRAAYIAAHPGQLYRTVENTIGRSEDFGRALQYYSNKKGFKAEGKSPEVAKTLAADQARHNSTNFFRHGSVGKGVNLAIPYWNAGVQGARIQTRRIKERPVQTIAKIGFTIAAPSAMIAVNNYSNEKNREVMENIPQYEKDGNIIIVGPDAKFDEKTNRWEDVTKIPVPPQHIGIHKTIQDAVRSSYTGKAFDVLDNLGRIVEDYTTINPTDPKALANRVVPQALKLVAEPMTNTNFFTGKDVVPDSQKNLPAPDQYSDYTSGTAKTIGKVTNTSPRVIDNAIRTGMGGAGQNVVNATDSILAGLGVIGKDEVRGTNLVDSVTKRFSGAAAINPSEKADEQFNKLKGQLIKSDEYKKASQYDKSRMLNRLEGDINAVAYDKAGKSDKKLTSKQQSLAENGLNTDTYTNLDSSSSKVDINKKISKNSRHLLTKFAKTEDREKWFAENNDAEYEYYNAKYENDKANGEISKIQDVERTKKMRKSYVGKDYRKDTRDLYNLTKDEIADYLANDKDGNALAEELYKYDRALYDAGLTKYLKFKNGLAKSTGGRKSSGRKGGSKKSDTTAGKALVALTSGLNGIRVPKTTGTKAGARAPISAPTFRKTPLKRYKVAEAKASKKLKTTVSKA